MKATVALKDEKSVRDVEEMAGRWLCEEGGDDQDLSS